MASPTVYEFVFREAGGGGGPIPASAGGATAAGQRAAPQQPQGPRQPTTRAQEQQQQTDFLNRVFQIIDRASRLSFVGPLGRASIKFVKPILDLADLFKQFAATQGAANSATTATRTVAGATAENARFRINSATMTIDTAIINVRRQVLGGPSPSPTAPRSGGGSGGGGSGTLLNLPPPSGLPGPATRAVGPGAMEGDKIVGIRLMSVTTNAAQAVSRFALTIGQWTAIAAGAVLVTGALIYAFKKLSDRANMQADTLRRFSAPLATAQAQASVNTLMQQQRSAQNLGPELARMVDAQNRVAIAQTVLVDKFEKLFVPLKSTFLEGWAKVIESLDGIDENTKKQWQELARGNFMSIFEEIEDLNILTEGVDKLPGKEFKFDAVGAGRIDFHP